MRVVFASGKGGTGKTTVAVNVARFLADAGQRVQYLDCDVEEPNGHLFLKPRLERSDPATVMVPVIDQEKCTSCGRCSELCQFNALVTLPGTTMLFPELCHGCGLCVRTCPEAAMTEGTRPIGVVETGSAGKNLKFAHGVLNVGEPMAGPLIQQVKELSRHDCIQIIDAPPGTACPVVKTMLDAEAVVLVTEPTPFGLHDLKVIVKVARNLGVTAGVVINRQNGKFPALTRYVNAEGLDVLATLPEDREVAVRYSKSELIVDTMPEYRDRFMLLVERLGLLTERSQRSALSWK